MVCPVRSESVSCPGLRFDRSRVLTALVELACMLDVSLQFLEVSTRSFVVTQHHTPSRASSFSHLSSTTDSRNVASRAAARRPGSSRRWSRFACAFGRVTAAAASHRSSTHSIQFVRRGPYARHCPPAGLRLHRISRSVNVVRVKFKKLYLLRPEGHRLRA